MTYNNQYTPDHQTFIIRPSDPQDVTFSNGLTQALRAVQATKGASPEDLMSNPTFESRWADVVKARSEEMAKGKTEANNGTGGSGAAEDVDMAAAIDTTLRGSKAMDRCAPDTKEYWDSYAAQLIRQYLRLSVEGSSAVSIANEIKNSTLSQDFAGEPLKSSICIILEADNLQESVYRPMERRPLTNQAVVAKLLNGVLSARNGTVNEDGLRTSPCDQDIMLLVDGARDSCKQALQDSQYGN